MKFVDIDQHTVYPGAAGASAPVIYVVDASEHPFDLSESAADLACTVVTVAVRNWNDSLTPWPAPGIYRGEPDFGGDAATTLAELVDEAIPAIEAIVELAPAKRAICGYSLGGLFALYAFAHADAGARTGATTHVPDSAAAPRAAEASSGEGVLPRMPVFAACACLSGSVWYQGWVDHLRGLDFDGTGRFAFLSIGSKEKHAAPKILHHVQDNMAECADILRAHGCEAEFAVGPGNHMAFIRDRFAAGLTALDRFLT